MTKFNLLLPLPYSKPLSPSPRPSQSQSFSSSPHLSSSPSSPSSSSSSSSPPPSSSSSSSNHWYVNKYEHCPLQVHSCRTLNFFEKNNVQPHPKRVIHFFSQCPRTIRGSIDHLYVNKYRYFPLQIHFCKTFSCLEKNNVKPYPKRIVGIFSQRPRTISNDWYVNKYKYFPYKSIPVGL